MQFILSFVLFILWLQMGMTDGAYSWRVIVLVSCRGSPFIPINSTSGTSLRFELSFLTACNHVWPFTTTKFLAIAHLQRAVLVHAHAHSIACIDVDTSTQTTGICALTQKTQTTNWWQKHCVADSMYGSLKCASIHFHVHTEITTLGLNWLGM